MDLTKAANDLVADYSHGMRKKIALSAALLPAPRLLFLDEPFEGIDAIASRQIKDLLSAYVRGGGTVFLTTHILEIVERLCNHIGIIHKGRLVAQGSMAELRAGGTTGQSLEERLRKGPLPLREAMQNTHFEGFAPPALAGAWDVFPMLSTGAAGLEGGFLPMPFCR